MRFPCLDAVAHGGNPQDRAASLSPYLPISPSPHLPISPSPHLPTPPTLPLIMGIQADLILLPVLRICPAKTAAPKPLSIFTTPMPGAQEFNMVNRGAIPPKLAP